MKKRNIKVFFLIKNIWPVIAILAVYPLAGCNSVSESRIESANYGEIPLDYKKQIENKLSNNKKEKNVLRFNFYKPKKCYGIRPMVGLFKSSFGHCVEVSVEDTRLNKEGATSHHNFFIRGHKYLIDVTGNPRVHLVN